MAIAVPAMGSGTYSGFWNLTGDNTQYAPLSRTAQGWRAKLEWELAFIYGKQQMREIKAAQLALLGVAPGGVVLAQYSRVQAPSGPAQAVPQVTSVADIGGLIPIENVVLRNSVSNAADVTYLTSLLDGSMRGAKITFAVDIGGNGANNRPSQIGV